MAPAGTAFNHGFGLVNDEELPRANFSWSDEAGYNRVIGELIVMLPRLWSTLRSAMCNTGRNRVFAERRRTRIWYASTKVINVMAERDMRIRDGRDRRGTEIPPVSRRVLLAAGGAVLLTSAAAAVATELAPGAHGARTHARREAGRISTGASAPPKPGEANPAAVPPDRQQPVLTRGAARQPRREQPSLPYGEPMYTVEGGPKVVALTIDDGPSLVYTPQILGILSQYGIIASFSMIGQNAAAFPGVAREVAAAGHAIVNHTWNHYNLRYMSAWAVQDEISRATDAIHAATGEWPSMFRAPYGVWPPTVFSACAQAGLTPLAWSVDPRDWSRPGVRTIVRDILSATRTGSIILEHDGGGNRSETVAALKIWLPRLLDAGYQFTTP